MLNFTNAEYVGKHLSCVFSFISHLVIFIQFPYSLIKLDITKRYVHNLNIYFTYRKRRKNSASLYNQLCNLIVNEEKKLSATTLHVEYINICRINLHIINTTIQDIVGRYCRNNVSAITSGTYIIRSFYYHFFMYSFGIDRKRMSAEFLGRIWDAVQCQTVWTTLFLARDDLIPLTQRNSAAPHTHSPIYLFSQRNTYCFGFDRTPSRSVLSVSQPFGQLQFRKVIGEDYAYLKCIRFCAKLLLPMPLHGLSYGMWRFCFGCAKSAFSDRNSFVTSENIGQRFRMVDITENTRRPIYNYTKINK